MIENTPDSAVEFVLQQIETMVASEGGSLELLSVDESCLKIRYEPGVNEECPECVPTHDQVAQFLNASLKIHAPHIDAIEVV
ncbi:MAG: hypothetical protein WD333_02160 [Dehalococcoidia bacterium]